jgi:hypothetical protein
MMPSDYDNRLTRLTELDWWIPLYFLPVAEQRFGALDGVLLLAFTPCGKRRSRRWNADQIDEVG